MICITHKKECTSQRSAYLIKKHNITRERVLNLLRTKNTFYVPNVRFAFPPAGPAITTHNFILYEHLRGDIILHIGSFP